MLHAAAEALSAVLTPTNLLFLFLGVTAGLLLGILPGLGGVAGMAILLPFLFGVDPHQGIALLIGLMAANTISDTFPAVLMGIPGSSAGSAVILDGYPLARRGEAGRAIGAALFATMMGGVFGALLLLVSIPVAKPIMLAFGTPELFMLTLLGVSMVGILAKGTGAAGILSGLLGLLASSIGGAPSAPEFRYTFDSLYLNDGLPLVVVALGLFGMAELVDLLLEGRAISRVKALDPSAGVLSGIRDAFKHKWVILRNSAIGSFLGLIPGLSGTAVQWLAYGLTKHTSKNPENFGKGEIKGIVASESAVNANEGGALIPMLFFGLPVSAGAALMISALTLMGVRPGPSMVTPEQMPFLFTAIWSLALANVIGVLFCFGITRWVVKLTTISTTTLMPFILVIVVLAAYQATSSFGDIITLLLFGAMGWLMKQIGWPRVPMLIGFVLGTSSERYLSRSVARYGWDWLTFPTVLGMAALMVVLLFGGVLLNRGRRAEPEADSVEDGPVTRQNEGEAHR